MIYLSNQDIAKLLTPKDCIDALDKPQTKMDAGYHRHDELNEDLFLVD